MYVICPEGGEGKDILHVVTTVQKIALIRAGAVREPLALGTWQPLCTIEYNLIHFSHHQLRGKSG